VAVERAAAERAVADLLVALGADPQAEHLAATPRRVAAALERLLTPRPFDGGTFTSDAVDDGLVVARDIRFRSLCAHHLVPFDGVAHVGFVPDGHTVGLSKLARIVESCARDLQVQERLTRQIASRVQCVVVPKGVGVVVEAGHPCESTRGEREVTSTVLGVLRDDPRARQEFMALARSGRTTAD
jgi:GTP cyclohydrolase I